jgi:RimJ/RimL family protein N-acetyltransferase
MRESRLGQIVTAIAVPTLDMSLVQEYVRLMKLIFRKLDLSKEKQLLVEWLSTSTWPFHGNSNLSPEKVEKMIVDGVFDGTNHQTFWIVAEKGMPVGYVRLFDLDDIGDGTPLFDVRLKPESRGRGIGYEAVRWLLDYMFEKWPELHRIEGTTRQDNIAMRRVFQKCNFVKEGHLRKAWKTTPGLYYDAILYGILRDDWLAGKAGLVDWHDEPSSR